MDARVLLPTVASVALILAVQASVWWLWIDMAEKSIEAPLNQLLLTRSLRANHVLNNTLQPVSLTQELLRKCAPVCAVTSCKKCGVTTVAASVNDEVADFSTQHTTSSGNVTSLIVTKPCDLISYMAGLQQVPTLARISNMTHFAVIC